MRKFYYSMYAAGLCTRAESGHVARDRDAWSPVVAWTCPCPVAVPCVDQYWNVVRLVCGGLDSKTVSP